jgi:hypothetical protein
MCVQSVVVLGCSGPIRENPRSGHENNGEWPSSVGHLLWEQEVGGSNPPSPTICAGSRQKREMCQDIGDTRSRHLLG